MSTDDFDVGRMINLFETSNAASTIRRYRPHFQLVFLLGSRATEMEFCLVEMCRGSEFVRALSG
jgi:hypothetical protein